MKKKFDKWKPRKYWCIKSNNWKKLHHIPMGRNGKKTCYNNCELPFVNFFYYIGIKKYTF